MKTARLAITADLLQSLLEDEEIDWKDVEGETDPQRFWEQIDGDYGDPWTYGASWFNSMTREIIHWDGLEAFENKGEVDPDDVPIPASMTAKLDRLYPLEGEDVDAARNQDRRDDLIRDYQYARAAYLSARHQYPIYFFNIEDALEPWMKESAQGAAGFAGITAQQFAELPLEAQYIVIGQYSGFDNFGSPIRMSQRELEQKLGQRL